MLNLSKSGQAIFVTYSAKNFDSGETVTMDVYDNSNTAVSGSPFTLSELASAGIYGTSFTPASTGDYKVVVKENGTEKSHASVKVTSHDIESVGGDVTSIKSLLENASYGNSALYDELIAMQGSGFATGTDSLEAIKDYLVNTIQASISGISNNTRTSVSIPTQMLRPASGNSIFKIFLNIYDSNGNMEDADIFGGYQESGLTGKTGTTATGLADSTQYYFKVNDDGNGVTEYNITTDGTAGVDFDEMIGLMNTAVTGATFSIVDGDLRCTSDSTGDSSSIALSAGTTGTDLFATLTGFTAFDTAVVGSATAMVNVAVVDESGNDRNTNLAGLDASTLEGSKWMTRESEGRFSCTYSVSSTADIEQLLFTFRYDEAGSERIVDRASNVTVTLDVNDTVDSIYSEVTNVTYGLNALKSLIDTIDTVVDANQVDLTNIEAKVDIIDTVVDNNYSLLTNGVYGLSALKTLIDAIPTVDHTTQLNTIESKIDTLDTNVDTLVTGQTDMKGATFSSATDSLEAISNKIDSIDIQSGGNIA